MHSVKTRLIKIISICLITAMLLPMMAFGAAAAAPHTVTTAYFLNLRESATTASSVLKLLYPGTVMTLLEDSSDGWAHVTAGSTEGYVSTAYLSVPEGSDVEITATATDYVNLRKGNGTSHPVYISIPFDVTVPVTDNSDENWAQVEYLDYEGYASKNYLIINFVIPVRVHRSASAVSAPTLTTSHSVNSSKLMLSASQLFLDINETSILTVINHSAVPMAGGVSYTSSDEEVVSVSSLGLVKGLRQGKAVVTVTQSATGEQCSCAVTVSSVVMPTEPDEPMTEPPTQPVTEAPTEPETEPATEPVTEPQTEPQTEPDTQSASTLKLSAESASLYVGCAYQLIADCDTAVTWSSSDSSVATISSDGFISAQSAGTAIITARSGDLIGECQLTVISGSSVNLSHSTATVSAGKTFLARSRTSGVSWSSTDPSVATVNNGYIFAKNPGKTVVTASTSKGAATMLVTVTAAEPIRFAYTSPNCAVKDQTVTLIAITDQKRTAVRFNVTVGAVIKSVDATSCERDGSTLIWKGTMTFSNAGTYKVAAYSQLNGKWSTCSDGATTAFVSDTEDKTTTVCTARRASDEVIRLIATFEGYISSIYDDPITGDPTVGYGRVIFSGQQFYNTMTKNEAFAYLVQTVNNDGYSSSVNSFFLNNSVKFNQQQFDALVCLVYNTGSGVLGDSELKRALLNCADGTGGETVHYINGSYVRIRTGPGTDYEVISMLDSGTEVTVLSQDDPAWFEVQLADGTTGYVSSDYISQRATGGDLDLNYVDRQNLINKFCAYHHAAGYCIMGLLYRRVDEMEIFFYGEYKPNYGDYLYDIRYSCARNPSVHT